MPLATEEVLWELHSQEKWKIFTGQTNAGDPGLIPRSGRSPVNGNDYPLQYSCLQNPTNRGAWRATVHSVTQNRTWLKLLSTHMISNLGLSWLASMIEKRTVFFFTLVHEAGSVWITSQQIIFSGPSPSFYLPLSCWLNLDKVRLLSGPKPKLLLL